MAVRSKGLFRIVSVLGSALVYTAPSGETVLLKQASFFNSQPLAITFRLELGNIGGSVKFPIWAGSIPAGEVREWAGWHVLQPSQTIFTNSTLAGVHVWASGTELEGVAD